VQQSLPLTADECRSRREEKKKLEIKLFPKWRREIFHTHDLLNQITLSVCRINLCLRSDTMKYIVSSSNYKI
jgi:hypothetical protein